ncbi:hypothetical protein PIB30_106322 [Stylosanthes scabra]|uniref:Uncharacterized protein n=1 Tax=Stylosanthes scabra TaxID=79078 RepID=A0ABU6XWN2_9FABA|nr:hypothetical protein [Stylosanthes scabra]
MRARLAVKKVVAAAIWVCRGLRWRWVVVGRGDRWWCVRAEGYLLKALPKKVWPKGYISCSGRYITAEVMETVRVPRIVQQHQPRNEDEDHEMPEYEPENEADFDNLQHEQQHHQFQQPPQQQYHHQQPPYEDYHQFQQTMMEQQQQGFNSINEMLARMQLQQQNMFQGLQTTQNQYLEELRALKTR